MKALPEEDRRLRGARAAGQLLQPVDLQFARPILDIVHMAQALGVSHQSASRCADALEREGILCKMTGQARNRVYCAEAVLPLTAPLTATPWRPLAIAGLF